MQHIKVNCGLDLITENGEKLLKIGGTPFDPRNPDDIIKLFQITGHDRYSLHQAEDEEEINEIHKVMDQRWKELFHSGQSMTAQEREEKEKSFSQEKDKLYATYAPKAREIRKWIYDYEVKPGIKLFNGRTSNPKGRDDFNLSYCKKIEASNKVYTKLGEIFSLFSKMSIPCNCAECNESTLVNQDDPFYEVPDSVWLSVERPSHTYTYQDKDSNQFQYTNEDSGGHTIYHMPDATNMNEDDWNIPGKWDPCTIMTWHYDR